MCVCVCVCVCVHFSDLLLLGVCVCPSVCVSVGLVVIPWTAACQAPLSMEFSRQEYLSGLPFPTPGDLPRLGTESIFGVTCIGRWILYY